MVQSQGILGQESPLREGKNTILWCLKPDYNTKAILAKAQGDLDIASYFNKAKRISDEFTAANGMPRRGCKKCECDIDTQL